VAAESLLNAGNANVSANRIIRPLRPLVGFDTVFNRDAASGGSDIETNAQVINRYYLSLMGTSPGTVYGINKTLRDQYLNVADSNVVFGNNPANIRSATDGGAVDVYIIGSIPLTATENIVFPGANQIIPLSYQPVNAILSAGAYVQGTDFELVDDTSGYSNSNRASDGIRWLPSGSSPTIGDVVTVTYTYNSLVSSLQSAFLADDRNVPSRDILFKVGDQVDITVSANIKIRSGFAVSTVTSAVISAIENLINSNKLGDGVEASDIQAVVRSFSSVDNFIITNLSKVGETGTADISLSDNEYSRIESADIILTVIY
jgi:hypothetical protein